MMEGPPGADSEEKHEPASDVDTVAVDSLKALDPEWPIREDCSTLSSNPMMEGPPGADSEEKHEPASDVDTVAVDSLKALDPEWPIREADIPLGPSCAITGREQVQQHACVEASVTR